MAFDDLFNKVRERVEEKRNPGRKREQQAAALLRESAGGGAHTAREAAEHEVPMEKAGKRGRAKYGYAT